MGVNVYTKFHDRPSNSCRDNSYINLMVVQLLLRYFRQDQSGGATDQLITHVIEPYFFNYEAESGLALGDTQH